MASRAKYLKPLQSATLVIALPLLACGAGAPTLRPASTDGGPRPIASHAGAKPSAAGSYASVNGLKMYYEVHGSGAPIVLLHGAFCTIETDFRKLIPVLSKKYQVIAVEQQAHGRTADIDRPLTYANMASDTAALLKQLGIQKADFVGYSMGGATAIELAVHHAEIVRKVVFFGGASYAPAGYLPGLLEFEKTMKPEHFQGSPWKRSYDEIAPQPENFPALVDKIRTLDLGFEGWKPAEIKGIQAPTLLVIGDSDVVRPEHTVEMFRLLGGGVAGDLAGLPNARLAVLPSTTHVSIIERTDWLAAMTSEFLDAPTK